MKYQNKVNVLSFLFNRPKHTAETLGALLEQKEFINEIFFYIDKPTREEDKKLQDEVISILLSLIHKHDLKNYHIIRRDENYGIAKSITTATNEYSIAHSIPFVVIEDDCKPHSMFMSFMAYVFEEYKEDDSVYTVCGYQYEEDDADIARVELSRRFNPWGWGSWPHKWNFEWRDRDFTEEETSTLPNSVKKFTEDKSYINGKMDIWSTTVVIKQFINKLNSVVPTRSLIENIGNDGTGVHSDATDVFDISSREFKFLELNNAYLKCINNKREQIIEDSLAHILVKVMNKK